MGNKNSPNSVAIAILLWQIGSGTVKREKRQSRLIERRRERITKGLNDGGVRRNVPRYHDIHELIFFMSWQEDRASENVLDLFPD